MKREQLCIIASYNVRSGITAEMDHQRFGLDRGTPRSAEFNLGIGDHAIQKVASSRFIIQKSGNGKFAHYPEARQAQAEAVLGDGFLAQHEQASRTRSSEYVTRTSFQETNFSNQQPLSNEIGDEDHTFANTKFSNKLHQDELSAILPTFSGNYHEDVNHFLKILNNTKQVLQVNEFTMKLVLIKQLKQKAQTWLFSKADFMLKSYQDLCQELQAVFDVSNVYQLRTQLAKRTWSGRENFEEYYQSKRIFAQKLNLPEEEFVQYLVEGIEDQTLRNQARIRNFKNVNDVIQAFRLIQLDPVPFRRKMSLCYSCSQPGHFAAECRFINNHLKDRSLERKNVSPPTQKLSDKTVNVLEDQDSKQKDEQVQCDGIVNFRFLNSTTHLKALFDTGSPISLIRRGLIDGKHIKIIDQSKT